MLEQFTSGEGYMERAKRFAGTRRLDVNGRRL
jgi:hypothetical protein